MTMFHHFSWSELWEMEPWEFDSVLSLTAGYIETEQTREKHKAMTHQF